ncbi:hypothetical protein [Paenibacillus kyungheensis]
MFPKTLDFYQIELTNMLETERYGEAMSLLDFLLHCQGQSDQQIEEWESLLGWLRMSFPEAAIQNSSLDQQEEEENHPDSDTMMRDRIKGKQSADHSYESQLLETAMQQPVTERTLLALEQLSYLDQPKIDDKLIEWLQTGKQHPLIQFRILQTLRRRGHLGNVSFERDHEWIEVEVENVPLEPAEFPLPVIQILERVADKTESDAPNLFYFAQELWSQFMMGIYGTSNYQLIARGDDAELDIWAAALHQTVSETLEGSKEEESIRLLYGVTDNIRFRYEQAYRAMHQFVSGQLPRS